MTIEVSVETISPQYANTLLKNHNTNNYRKVKEQRVELYASTIKRGEWLPEASTIVIDVNGVLTNGQHRLLAILKSGTAIDMIIVRNADPRSRYVIDDHMPRSMSDHVGCLKEQVSMVNTFLRAKNVNLLTVKKRDVDFYKHLIKRDPNSEGENNEGEVGRLTALLHSIYGKYNDKFTSYGIRGAIILSVLDNQLKEVEALELFKTLTTFTKTKDKNTKEMKHVKPASERAKALSTLTPLMSKLVDILEAGNLPIYDGKSSSPWIELPWKEQCHPAPKLMPAVYQAIHKDTKNNTDFEGFLSADITKSLGL
tara:strand:- start:94 stop:1026 length:933 start_codon:yes stop_codon:yes gene_type:complete